MENRIFVIAVVVVSLIVVALVLQPTVREQLAPEPVAAWVAIEVADTGVARAQHRFELEVGAAFRLHAVLEARDRNDRPVYYTEAKALWLGDQPVAAESLRAWDPARPVKVRWFTVEGRRPYVELEPELGVKGFTLQEFLRSEWPVSWSIPGEIDAANDNHLERGSALAEQRFGTQRYHVRIELYRDEDQMIPNRVIRSWGIDDLKEHVDRFPTVVLALPGRVAPASRVFGLAQLEAVAGSDPGIRQQIDELAGHGIAFSRLTVLRDQIRNAGLRLEDLTWRDVDLRGEMRWGAPAAAGDLLRAGDRVVVLYEDRGAPGLVDYGDLCFDFVRGATVRALGDVFAGDEDDTLPADTEVIVELASLEARSVERVLGS